jgi:peptide deformylase
MPILPINIYPDSVLRKVALPIEKIDQEITDLANSMFETMYDAPGIGLAGPQVGVSKRIFVVDIGVPDDTAAKSPIVFINPKITKTSGENKYEEGCLSLPGIREIVYRPSDITIQALNLEGNEFSLDASGLLATCIQHELDHLDGILFTDHLQGLKKRMAHKKLDKLSSGR